MDYERTVIAAHDKECAWLMALPGGKAGWTDNIFAASALPPNDAARLAHKLKQAGHDCATEPLVIAARRHQRVFAEMRTGENQE